MSKMKKRGNGELSVIGRKQLCGGASISHRDAPTKGQIGKLGGMKEGTLTFRYRIQFPWLLEMLRCGREFPMNEERYRLRNQSAV